MRARAGTTALVVSLTLLVGGASAWAAAGDPAPAARDGQPTGRDDRRPVGVVTRTFVDRGRRTPADVSAGIAPASRRVLPTTIYFPARGSAPPGTVTRDAKPARGAHPLVLFNPGSPGVPEDYDVLLSDWAAHGYVVVAVEFPVSSVAGPDDVAWRDLPAQTKDARFVLGKVLDLDPGRAGIPEIDDDRMAVAGHSFGGATALSLASKCCRDDRFAAVVALAAVTRPRHGPSLEEPTGPVLFVHARGDRAVSYPHAVVKCRRTSAPKRFLTVEGIRGLRAHVVPYVGQGDDWSAVVRPAIVDFLDGYLLDRKAARTRLDRAGSGTAVAGITRCPPDGGAVSPRA